MANTDESFQEKSGEKVKKAINHVWTFLKDYTRFANTHGAEFISDNHWETFVPATIQTQLLALSRDALVSLPLDFHQEDCEKNDLGEYIKEATSCHLENLDVLSSQPESCSESFKDVVAESMSEKKLHEVEIMANAVAGLVHNCNSDLVVDIGSGKGYLSLELAGHHRLNVIGLDANQGNTHGAQHRKEKLNSKWPALVAKTDKTQRNTATEVGKATYDTDGKLMDCYIPITQYVSPDMNLSSIISQHAMHLYSAMAPENIYAVIAGLHTCGSLAVSTMSLYMKDPRAVGLYIVGCCYQLMEEDGGAKVQKEIHFPLSQYGKSLSLLLGRNARNLASQSVHRIAASGQLQGEEFYWRALLEVMIQKLDIPRPERIMGIRGLNKRNASFIDYARKAFDKLGFPCDLITPEFASKLEQECQHERAKMAAYFQLKLALAPVVESLILLDRLMFLMEQPCIRTAGLVRLFDPVTSPRCYGIFATKTK